MVSSSSFGVVNLMVLEISNKNIDFNFVFCSNKISEKINKEINRKREKSRKLFVTFVTILMKKFQLTKQTVHFVTFIYEKMKEEKKLMKIMSSLGNYKAIMVIHRWVII